MSDLLAELCIMSAIGDFIEISWEGDPDEEFVRGHVTPEEARASIRHAASWDCPDDAPTRHTWARWVPDATGEYDKKFYICESQRRGCFPVTAVGYDR